MRSRAVALVVSVAAWIGASDVHGHHAIGSSFAGPRLDPFTRLRLETPLPRFSSSLGWELHHHGRLREGSAAYPESIGSVTAQTLALDTRLELDFDGTLGVRQPVTSISARPTGEPVRTLTGLGDTSVYGGYAIPFIGTPGRPGAIQFEALVGVTFPTGRYETAPLLSLSAVEPSAAGGLELFTHDTRSSPGTGALATFLGADVAWQWLRSSEWLFGASAVVPVTDTRDGISWGSDLTFAASNRLAPFEWMFVEPGADLRLHLRDRVPIVDADTGAARLERTGERREAAGRLGAGVAFGADSACSIRGRLPFWQHAGGVQLMETFSIEAGCMLALAL